MSPIDRLRHAIHMGSWEELCAGFELLTGERVSPPPASKADQLLGRIRQLLAECPDGPQDGPGEDEAQDDGDDGDVDDQDDEDEPARAEAPAPPRPAQDFTIEHGAARSDKGQHCRAVPMDTGPGRNRWKDTGKLASDTLAESRQLSSKLAGRDKEQRQPFCLVSVSCSRCQRRCEVHPDNAPRRLDPSDEPTAYICDRCLDRPGRR